MYTDIYKDQLQKAYLFGTAVLYSDKPIPREDVPQDWFSYEFRGTVQFRDEPYALEDTASYNYAGSVLSPLPLKKDAARSRLVKDKFELTALPFSRERLGHCRCAYAWDGGSRCAG